jgi:tRNA dimethylallyltransferase
MLYFKALREGLDALPGADAATRATLDAEAAERGWPALHAELRAVDPRTAARLPPADAQRIQRALEVYRLSGRPLSDWHGAAGGPGARSAGHAGHADTLPLLSLEPDDRAWLHGRIAERFDAMLAQGLVDEVRSLRARPDLGPDLPSMRCVGYRQIWQALAAGDLRPVREQGIAATRQLAKRQLTWLRSITDRRRVSCDRADAQQQALQCLEHWAARALG